EVVVLGPEGRHRLAQDLGRDLEHLVQALAAELLRNRVATVEGVVPARAVRPDVSREVPDRALADPARDQLGRGLRLALRGRLAVRRALLLQARHLGPRHLFDVAIAGLTNDA